MKNPNDTPSGIEPANFRFVAQHLNHCATAVPLSFGLTPFKIPTAPFRLTSLHFTALLDDFRHISIPFISNCFPNSVSKNLRLHKKLTLLCDVGITSPFTQISFLILSVAISITDMASMSHTCVSISRCLLCVLEV